MSDLKLIVLIVVALGTLVIAIVVSNWGDEQPQGARGPSNLIQGLDPSLIATIKVTEGESTVTLRRDSDSDMFVVTDKSSYPATMKEINGLINNCLDIKTDNLVTSRSANHDELEVSDEKATKRIEIAKADGGILASVIVGKTVTEPRSTYIRQAGSDDVYASTNVPYMRADAMSYINKQLCDAEGEKIVRVSIRNGNNKYVLSKQEGKVVLETVPEGKQLKESDAKQTFEALAGLNCSDVHQSVEGLEFNQTFLCSMEDSTIYTVELANKDDKTYATLSCVFTDQSDVQINPQAKDSEEELKAKEAKLLGKAAAEKFNERHKGWTYEIASWQADRLTKSPDDLLEDLPEPEPEEAEADEETASDETLPLGPVLEPQPAPVPPAIEVPVPAEEAPTEAK
jgi:hypothetical protein